MTPEGKVLLLVDDDEHLLLLGESFLGRLGMTIRTACSGNEAIATIQEGPTPDIIISDLNMPDGTGLDLLKYVRGTGAISGIPLFILSGTREPHEIETVQEFGCTAFFTKPCDYSELLRKVAQQLSVKVRHTPRFAVDLVATLHQGDEVADVLVRNLGESGVYFEADADFGVDSIFRLDIELPRAAGEETLSVQITPTRKVERPFGGRHPYGYGCRILTTTEWKRRLLEGFLATLT